MSRSIGKNFTIPPGWMGISSMIGLSIWILFYEQIYTPAAKRIRRTGSRLTMQQRISIGIGMSILCMLVAGTVEKERRALALKSGTTVSPLHVAALLPQFALSGLTEAFAAVALMEFFTLKVPESMRSVAGSIFFVSLAIGSYVSSLMVNVIHRVTEGGEGGGRAWLGGRDLNMNKLDNYYYMVGCVGVINLVYFRVFAKKYLPDQMRLLSEDEESVENPKR